MAHPCTEGSCAITCERFAACHRVYHRVAQRRNARSRLEEPKQGPRKFGGSLSGEHISSAVQYEARNRAPS